MNMRCFGFEQGMNLEWNIAYVSWYIDGSNPDTPVAEPTEGVQTNAFDFVTGRRNLV